MIKKNDILRILQDNADEITGYGVKKIGIFGSFARSSAKNKSDIDILVEFRSEFQGHIT